MTGLVHQQRLPGASQAGTGRGLRCNGSPAPFAPGRLEIGPGCRDEEHVQLA